MTESTARVAIIGAGMAGLACAEALRSSFEIRLFDSAPTPGGLWAAGLAGPMTKNTHQNSAVSVQGLPGRPMQEIGIDFPHWTHAAAYVEAYARSLDLGAAFQGGARVDRMTPTGAGWAVGTAEEAFDAVIVATGSQSTPRPTPPEYAGFRGELLHVRHYSEPSLLAGKRVLIVGGARPSTVDTALDAAAVADRVVISARSPLLFLPCYWAGKPTEVFLAQASPGELVPLFDFAGQRALEAHVPPASSLAEADMIWNDAVPLLAREGRVEFRKGVRATSGRTVMFVDGSAEEFDIVVLCIGYQPSFPCESVSVALEGDLSLNLFHRTRDDLFFVGAVHPVGSHWDVFYEQALAVRAFLLARAAKSSGFAQFREVRASGTVAMPRVSPRHRHLVAKVPYLTELRRWTELLLG